MSGVGAGVVVGAGVRAGVIVFGLVKETGPPGDALVFVHGVLTYLPPLHTTYHHYTPLTTTTHHLLPPHITPQHKKPPLHTLLTQMPRNPTSNEVKLYQPNHH